MSSSSSSSSSSGGGSSSSNNGSSMISTIPLPLLLYYQMVSYHNSLPLPGGLPVLLRASVVPAGQEVQLGPLL